MKKFLYFPSFDTGVSRSVGRKNLKLKDGTPWRFWDTNYPLRYRHPYFLVTAGHGYKHMDHSSRYEFTNDTIVLGDSGGFQIASGYLKWSTDLRKSIFHWLELNSNVAMNLDIPPRMQYEGRFNESIELSIENFKFFMNNQSGTTDFLNIIQGSELNKYQNWYNAVKQFEFQGWSIGGSGSDINATMAGLAVLLNGKEFNKDSIKWLHILGASGVDEFMIFAQIQKSLNELGSPCTVTTDSSTPSKSTAYGFYYTGYNFKNLTFQYIQLPRKSSLVGNGNVESLPIYNVIDEHIWSSYSLNEFLEWKSEHYAWLIAHNFSIFIDCYNHANEYINSDRYILEQIISKDFKKLIDSVDEMIKSSNPIAVYNKYSQLYVTFSRQNRRTLEVSNEFF